MKAHTSSRSVGVCLSVILKTETKMETGLPRLECLSYVTSFVEESFSSVVQENKSASRDKDSYRRAPETGFVVMKKSGHVEEGIVVSHQALAFYSDVMFTNVCYLTDYFSSSAKDGTRTGRKSSHYSVPNYGQIDSYMYQVGYRLNYYLVTSPCIDCD